MVELFQNDIRSCERRVEILIRPHRDHDIHELFTLSATLFFNMQYVKNAVCEQKKEIYANIYPGFIWLLNMRTV